MNSYADHTVYRCRGVNPSIRGFQQNLTRKYEERETYVQPITVRLGALFLARYWSGNKAYSINPAIAQGLDCKTWVAVRSWTRVKASVV